MHFSWVRFAASAGLFGSVVAACGAGASHAGENVGTLRADLVAKGPNGDTFQLPSGISFALTSASAPDAGASTLFFDTTTTQTSDTFSVPAGTYSGRLVGGPPWQLLDVTSGKTVNVNLLDTEPYSVVVTAGTTTALTFHFALQGVGNVTFGTGSLNTTFSVADASADSGAPTTGNFTMAGGVSGVVPVGTAPNAAIKTLMTQSSPTLFTFPNASFKLGPWTPAVDTVCATATLPAGFKPTTETLPDAGVTGDVDLIAEAMATGSTVQLCFGDQNVYPGASSAIEVLFTRTGVPTTTSVKNALGSTTTATFAFLVVGTPSLPSGTPVPYNGTLAEFSDFASPVSMTVQVAEIDFDPGAADEVAVTGSPGSGGITASNSTLTLQLSP